MERKYNKMLLICQINHKFTFTHLQHPPSLLSAKTAPGTNNVKYAERESDFSCLEYSFSLAELIILDRWMNHYSLIAATAILSLSEVLLMQEKVN